MTTEEKMAGIVARADMAGIATAPRWDRMEELRSIAFLYDVPFMDLNDAFWGRVA